MPTGSLDGPREGLSDRERLIQVEAVLRGLQVHFEDSRATDKVLWEERYRNLATQMLTVATTHERLAPMATVEKMQVHLEQMEKDIQVLTNSHLTRSEIETKFESVSVRMTELANGMNRLEASLLKLSTILQEDENQTKLATEKENTKRVTLFSRIGAVCAVAGLCVSLFLGLRSHNSSPPVTTVPTTTTTTTTVPGK